MSDLRGELQAIYDGHGTLTPPLLVEVARPVDHPLHDRFEWNDQVAGPLYREHQARALIRSVRIRYGRTIDGPKDVRAFVSVREPEQQTASYEPVESVMQDEFQRTLLLREMKREWRTFKRRWEWMREFGDLIRNDGAA